MERRGARLRDQQLFTGTVDLDGTVFQGDVTPMNLYGEGDAMFGKFLLFRPAPFGG